MFKPFIIVSSVSYDASSESRFSLALAIFLKFLSYAALAFLSNFLYFLSFCDGFKGEKISSIRMEKSSNSTIGGAIRSKD
jgi:hypothetical protein